MAFLLTLLFVPAVFSAESSAIIGNPGQQDRMMMPIAPPSAETQPYFLGQDQYYTVTFRGNGEAIVTGKIIFSNLDASPKNDISFKVTNVQPQDVVVYQVIREPQCIQYEPTTDPKVINPPCAQYQEPDYSGYFYGKSTYSKAITTASNDTVNVTLPNPVMANKSSAIVLYYRANGYAKKTFSGAYDFVFKTPEVNEKIRTLQVGLSTDSDLVIKGNQGNVNYGETAPAGKMMALDSASGGVNSAQFDQFYQQIGTGSVMKTATNLQANESYTVTGMFGTSQWQFYLKEVLLAVLVFVVLLLVIGIPLVRWLKKNAGKSQGITGANVVIGIVVGFITAIVLSVHTTLVYFVRNSLNRYYYESTIFLSLGIMIVAGSVYLLLLTLPSIIVGVKRGLWSGVITAVSTIVWLGIGLLIVGAVVLTTGQGRQFPTPMMMKAAPMDSSIQSAPAQGGTMELNNIDIKQLK